MSYRWHSDCKKKETCECCANPCAEEMKKRELYDPRDEIDLDDWTDGDEDWEEEEG